MENRIEKTSRRRRENVTRRSPNDGRTKSQAPCEARSERQLKKSEPSLFDSPREPGARLDARLICWSKGTSREAANTRRRTHLRRKEHSEKCTFANRRNSVRAQRFARVAHRLSRGASLHEFTHVTCPSTGAGGQRRRRHYPSSSSRTSDSSSHSFAACAVAGRQSRRTSKPL